MLASLAQHKGAMMLTLTHIISLFALPLLFVLWVVFQGWLSKQDPNYKGYKAGCGGCTRTCGEKEPDSCDSNNETNKVQYVDASSLWDK
ncbi:MAG: hypothetical protein GY694_18020 [Gammaproteobacteria bacterium]|nr:hypothetical protein [Gammaproteobacteria bacterium]